MKKCFSKFLVILLASGSLTGIAGATELDRPQVAVKNNSANLQQYVVYDLDPRYHRDPPVCAVIRPANPESAASVLAPLVDMAVATHAAGYLERVIAPRQRDRLVRKLAVDLNHPGDQQVFARSTGCRAVLTWRLIEASQTYVVSLSSRRVGLELVLRRFDHARPLWQAQHIAERSDGGLSFNPLGLLIDSVRAGRFNDNKDIMPSMIHDVVRRMLTSLPPTI
jgi:hypothetical protein